MDIILWPLRTDVPNLVVLDCLEWLQADLRTRANQGLKVKTVDLVRRLWVTVRSVSELASCLSLHRITDSGSPWGNIWLGEICHSYSKTRWRFQTRISPVTWDPDIVLTRSIAPPSWPFEGSFVIGQPSEYLFWICNRLPDYRYWISKSSFKL